VALGQWSSRWLCIRQRRKLGLWRKANEEAKGERKKNQTTQAAVKIVVEKHSDGYVAYPLGLKGVVVGEGDSYEAAMADVKSAIRFHIETFGKDVLGGESPVLEAFVAETEVAT
jgi:predicted RNase H-like HicB family nuclease